MTAEGPALGLGGALRHMADLHPRLVFMGTPELARVVLAALASDPRWTIPCVVAQPDKPVGRGLQVQPPPVKQEALERGIPVLQPAKARDPEFIAALAAMAPDVIVVAAYGQILPPALLAIPRFGCLNIHTSLLPRWRGAAPIQWALLEGDAETGVTLMRMDAGLDTGDIIAVEKTEIQPRDTGQTLHDRLAELGARLVCQKLPDWMRSFERPEDGTWRRSEPQPKEGVTYARRLNKEDGRLDWSKSAVELDRRIRGLNPWPGAFTTVSGLGPAPLILKIWEAWSEVVSRPGLESSQAGEVLVARGDELVVATGAAQTLKIGSLQLEGRRRMSTRDFLAGGALAPGSLLGRP